MLNITPFEDRWTTKKERFEVGNKLRDAFQNQLQAVKMVEQDESVELYFFLPGRYLLGLKRLPRFQEIREHLVPFPRDAQKRFVSYRWLSNVHPDPHGRQLRLIQKQVQPDFYYWIDYCCIPQAPMSADDRLLYYESLSKLPSLLFHVEVISIRQAGDGYLSRAWCFFEMLAGIVIADGITYDYSEEENERLIEAAERDALERALLVGTLPENLAVTNPDDLAPIRQMTETITTFFKLHTVMHYLTLGQELSRQQLFFGEDPYYFLAVYDMTSVIKWVFEKSREYRLPLNTLRNNEGTENYFLKLAEREEFYHDVDPRMFFKKVTMEQSKLAWFMIRKNKAISPELQSANDLFFILSALIQ